MFIIYTSFPQISQDYPKDHVEESVATVLGKVLAQNSISACTYAFVNGIWGGNTEHSLRIEISETEACGPAPTAIQVKQFARSLREAFDQDAVLIEHMPASSRMQFAGLAHFTKPRVITHVRQVIAA